MKTETAMSSVATSVAKNHTPQLAKYDAACRAVAEAKSVDEAKEIVGRAEAARAYARQTKNREMELDAIEIRTRAERRLGEIIVELKKAGHLAQGTGECTERGAKSVRLSDLGIDGRISSVAQRLAALPEGRFLTEIEEWREAAPRSSRIETPLQSYRVPSLRADRERTLARRGKVFIKRGDKFDKYRAIDGRRMADWRAGELQRLKGLAWRMYRCAETLQADMPIANPDPLATVEMIFKEAHLAKIFQDIWDEQPIHGSDAGIVSENIKRSEALRDTKKRLCQNPGCGKEFLPSHPSSKQLRGEHGWGRFCCRKCSSEGQRGVEKRTRQKRAPTTSRKL